MEHAVHQKLVIEGECFAPRDQSRLVEILPAKPSDSPVLVDKPAAEKEISEWISQSVTEAAQPGSSSQECLPPTLRLLIGSPRILEQNIWPLPFSNESFERILHTWGIPSFFLRSILRHIPIATTFKPTRFRNASGLLLRTNLTVSWQYSLAAVHDMDTNVTYCIIMGLASHEIKNLLASIRSVLQEGPLDISSYHSILPTILMDIAMDSISQDAERRRGELLQIYQATGLQGFRSLGRKPSKDEEQLELDLLTKLTHKLTALSDGCAGIKAVCKMQFRFLDAVRTFNACEEGSAHSLVSPTQPNASIRACIQQLHFIEQVLHGVESKIGYTQESAQCQVQTMYSLIEQKESRTHIEYADASSRIAAQNQKIAELTRRDSIDMRIVAMVTFIFLPGTFTATLFSASFFNFQPTTSSRVSPWIWLYVTFTTVLTAMVLIGWWYFAKKHNRVTEDAVRRDTWRRGIDNLRTTNSQRRKQARDAVLKTRPYLSGSVAGFNGLKEADENDGDIFHQEVELGQISPRNTFW